MRTLNQETLSRMEKYIIDYQRENGLTPSYRDIMRELSMSSLNLVWFQNKRAEGMKPLTSMPRSGK